MRSLTLVLTILTVGLIGCGGSEEHFDVAPVTGKVTVAGAPVSSGMIQFSPIPSGSNAKPGKTGTGDIQPDGTFAISTFGENDGAVIGKVKISAGPTDPTKPWKHELKQPLEYEVSPNGNQITIDIKPDGTGTVTASGS